MVNNDQFFCVGCGELMQHREADLLFITGFYRIVYPLGCCKACAKKAMDQEQSSRSGLDRTGVPCYEAIGTGRIEAAQDPILLFP